MSAVAWRALGNPVEAARSYERASAKQLGNWKTLVNAGLASCEARIAWVVSFEPPYSLVVC